MYKPKFVDSPSRWRAGLSGAISVFAFLASLAAFITLANPILDLAAPYVMRGVLRIGQWIHDTNRWTLGGILTLVAALLWVLERWLYPGFGKKS